MLDYPLIHALATVVRQGSFERAAKALFVTPSAVSQRIKTLEERMGTVLVFFTGAAVHCHGSGLAAMPPC